MSTARFNLYFSVPRYKNEWTRARWLALLGICGFSLNLRVHCWSKVAKRADEMLSTRLNSHITLTQIDEALRENGWFAGGLGLVLFVDQASCCEICPSSSIV